MRVIEPLANFFGWGGRRRDSRGRSVNFFILIVIKGDEIPVIRRGIRGDSWKACVVKDNIMTVLNPVPRREYPPVTDTLPITN
jgi:hypothetical protein